jgi:Sulfotransferase family
VSETADARYAHELRSARASARRVPDFFIVGHAKCGTTAMYRTLRQHPQIYMPAIKETQFFSRTPQERCAPPRDAARPGKRPQTLEAYLELFADALPEQIAGEASPQYIRSAGAAAAIAELVPDARVVVIFREPAIFLRSFHLQLLQVNIETESDLASALALEADRRLGRHIPARCPAPDRLLYFDHVRYVEQLRRFHEQFGRERVLTLIYDDFRADNNGVIRQVLRFLGVDDTVELRAADANPTVRVRPSRVHELAHRTAMGRSPVLGAVRSALKAATPGSLRHRALRRVDRAVVDSEPPPTDPALMQELRRRLRGEVEAFAEYVQRDLIDLWGYDTTK